MKQRMYNTFYRKLKNKFIANIVTGIGYMILKIYYYIISAFLKNTKNCIPMTDENISNARETVSKVRQKPEMNYNPKNPAQDEYIQLSIIVPAYNVEKYIEDCLTTVLNQKTKYKFEVIIVNDGSTDNTKNIIKKFEDERIIYIEQENQRKGIGGKLITECFDLLKNMGYKDI